MVIGLGLDLVEIARIKKAMEHPRFVYRVLTNNEREICHSPQCVAGRWAAKEAIAKAFGLQLRWQDVEILPDETGAPKASVEHAKFDRVRMRMHVSITHERGHAAAVAILERLTMQAPHA